MELKSRIENQMLLIFGCSGRAFKSPPPLAWHAKRQPRSEKGMADLVARVVSMSHRFSGGGGGERRNYSNFPVQGGKRKRKAEFKCHHDFSFACVAFATLIDRSPVLRKGRPKTICQTVTREGGRFFLSPLLSRWKMVAVAALVQHGGAKKGLRFFF